MRARRTPRQEPRTEQGDVCAVPTGTPGMVICPWCSQPTQLDYVHGHAQCVHCKHNIAPCCDGSSV